MSSLVNIYKTYLETFYSLKKGFMCWLILLALFSRQNWVRQISSIMMKNSRDGWRKVLSLQHQKQPFHHHHQQRREQFFRMEHQRRVHCTVMLLITMGIWNLKVQALWITVQECHLFLRQPISTRHGEGWVFDLGKCKNLLL